jgi:hypothetical protein
MNQPEVPSRLFRMTRCPGLLDYNVAREYSLSVSTHRPDFAIKTSRTVARNACYVKHSLAFVLN